VLARQKFGRPGPIAGYVSFAVSPDASGGPSTRKIRLREAKNAQSLPPIFVAIKNRPNRLFSIAYEGFLISPCSD
jgi:hypothetical protein